MRNALFFLKSLVVGIIVLLGILAATARGISFMGAVILDSVLFLIGVSVLIFLETERESL